VDHDLEGRQLAGERKFPSEIAMHLTVLPDDAALT